MEVQHYGQMLSTALNLCTFIEHTAMALATDIAYGGEAAEEALEKAYAEADLEDIMERWTLPDYQGLKIVRQATEAVLTRLEEIAEVKPT